MLSVIANNLVAEIIFKYRLDFVHQITSIFSEQTDLCTFYSIVVPYVYIP